MPSTAQQNEYSELPRLQLEMLDRVGDAPIARRIGPYELRDEIGQGGMAVVYRAWHTGLHRYEALKLPRRDADGTDTGYIQRLLTEARIAARLHHPHIVTIHNISEDGALQPYFSMDLIKGENLAQILLERGTLPLNEALPILQQTASAVAHAHQAGVVHRDLKPENILLQETAGTEWNAKVVDFGISRAAENQQGTRLTRSGFLIGTPEYMSPEQAGSGQPVDGRTDIYSLGIVAYEMLTGAPPFEAGDGVSHMAVLIAHTHAAPAPPHEVNPHISPAVSGVILKALAKNPEDRFASAEDFYVALESAAASAEPLSAASLVPPSRPWFDSWQAMVVAVLIGILLGCGTSLLIARYSAGEPAIATKPTLAAKPALAVKPQGTPKAIKAANNAPAPLPLVKHRETLNRAIAFSNQTRKTPYLDKGKSKVVRPGQNGVREVILEIAMRGDKQMFRRVLITRVLKAPLPQVELVGTRVAKSTYTPKTTPKTTRRSSTRSRRAKSVEHPKFIRRSSSRNPGLFPLP